MMNIEVEYCIDCHLHNWCSRHNERKYQQVFQQLQSRIRAGVRGVTLVKNQLPSYYIEKNNLSNLGLGLHRYQDMRNNQTVVFPRHGSFQIKVNGLLIFSKLQSNLWPNLEKIVSLICEIKSDLDSGKDLKRFSLQYRLQNPKDDAKFHDTYKKVLNFKINKRPQSSQFTTTKQGTNTSKQNKCNLKRKNVSCLKKGGNKQHQRKSDMDKKTVINLKDRRNQIINTYCNQYQDFNYEKEEELQNSKIGKIVKNQYLSPTSKKKIQFKNQVLHPIKPQPFKVSNKDKLSLQLGKKNSKKLIIKQMERQHENSPLVTTQKKSERGFVELQKQLYSTPLTPKVSEKETIRNRNGTANEKMTHEPSESSIKIENYQSQMGKKSIKAEQIYSQQSKISQNLIITKSPQQQQQQKEETTKQIIEQPIPSPQHLQQTTNHNDSSAVSVTQYEKTEKILQEEEPINRKDALHYEDDQFISQSCMPMSQALVDETLAVQQQKQQAQFCKEYNLGQPTLQNKDSQQEMISQQKPQEKVEQPIFLPEEQQQYEQQLQASKTSKSIEEVGDGLVQGMVLDRSESPAKKGGQQQEQEVIKVEVQNSIFSLQQQILLGHQQQQNYVKWQEGVNQSLKQLSEQSIQHQHSEHHQSHLQQEKQCQQSQQMPIQNDLYILQNPKQAQNKSISPLQSSPNNQQANIQQEMLQLSLLQSKKLQQQLKDKQSLHDQKKELLECTPEEQLHQIQSLPQQEKVEIPQEQQACWQDPINKQQKSPTVPLPLQSQQAPPNNQASLLTPSYHNIPSITSNISENIVLSLKTIYTQSSIALTNQIHSQLNDIYQGIELKIQNLPFHVNS